MTNQPASAACRGDGAADRASDRSRRRDDERLRLRIDPVRMLVSPGPWVAAWYVLTYLLVVGWVLFAIAFTATVTVAVFAITLAGIPLLVAAASVVRGCANVERRRLRLVFTEPVHGGYRAVTRPGLLAQVSTRWKDRATWRDTAYIIGLWLPLCLLDTVVFSVWATFLTGVTLPIWFWAPHQDFDNGTSAATAWHSATSRTARTGAARSDSGSAACPRPCLLPSGSSCSSSCSTTSSWQPPAPKLAPHGPCSGHPPTHWPRRGACSPVQAHSNP